MILWMNKKDHNIGVKMIEREKTYLYRINVKFLPIDITEIDRFLHLKKELGQGLSRNRFINTAIESYGKFAHEPIEVHRKKMNKRNNSSNRQTVSILATFQCWEVIKRYTVEFKATQMEIIRQALIDRIKAEGGEGLQELNPTPRIDDKWKNLWISGVSINNRLHLKRNSTNVIAHRNGIKYEIHEQKRRYYCFADLVEVLDLEYDESAKLYKHYVSEEVLKLQPMECFLKQDRLK